MDAAIYKVLSGAMVQMRRLDVASQDLANLNTSGYKGQRLAFTEVLAGVAGGRARSGGLVAASEQRTSFVQGQLQQTANPFHLAIEGEGFFAVETPRGIRYTRDGSFSRSADGTIVTSQGDPVLGEGGAIRVDGTTMQVTPEGAVIGQDGEVDKLRLVRFAEPRHLIKEGHNLFYAGDAPSEAAENFRALQGSLEQSNVNPIEGMVALITIQRQFEAHERAMRMMDSATSKMITEGARL
jgi:flagellar basal-body rod protein FlgF